jgi:hypothetical protein
VIKEVESTREGLNTQKLQKKIEEQLKNIFDGTPSVLISFCVPKFFSTLEKSEVSPKCASR